MLYEARKVQTSRKQIAKLQTVSQLETGRVTDRAPRPILLLVLRYENRVYASRMLVSADDSFLLFLLLLQVKSYHGKNDHNDSQRKDVRYISLFHSLGVHT